ncbi:hypothetical protein PBAL39_09926 [Pedobacter sp. BAL39]|uniref:DUF4129 domain-containing protein n=1 Tax=Pedobacter sp. BAL39 TaxID=391596 RepID=UPI000155A1E5|nr:DUF4129 domain-containing protein [Pedobacter sp. BAL39]EDM37453.1 hypothetical protein PBAL39_09926 [Pedobacter sp. BAL39]
MRRWFPFLLLIAVSHGSPVIAKITPPVVVSIDTPERLKTDSGALQLRKMDAGHLRSYRNNPDFKYDEGIVQVDGLWERFWSWFWRLISNLFNKAINDSTSTGTFIKYIALGLLVLLIGFLITRLAGLNLRIFSRKSKAVDVPYMELEDNIHEIDFNVELEKAVVAGNYRLAVRLFYLQSLKKLSDRNLIDWQPEKTNHAYVSELTDPERKVQFRQLTLQFEYVWYGEFFIEKESFAELRTAFEKFNRGLA